MKRTFTLFVLLVGCLGLIAQPVITSSFNPAPGDSYKYHPVTTPIAPGNSGANVTWDFSSIAMVYNPLGGVYMSPSATPYVNDFPGSNVAFEAYYVVGTFHYYETTSAKLEKKGEASVQGVAVYDVPQTIITYPFTYNTTTTSNYSCVSLIGTTTQTLTGLWEAHGDAYGTLILPSGTYNNVLRVKITNEYTKEYSDASPTQGVDGEEYWWVSTTSKAPLLRITKEYYSDDGVLFDSLHIRFIADEVSGINHPDQSVSNLNIYPNPASDLLNLTFDIQKSTLFTLDLYSADGKIIRSYEPEQFFPGNHRKELLLEDITPGFYMLRVGAGDNFRMMKFIKR